WISAEGVPAPSKNYKESDYYIDELTYNIYVNNGSEWQLIGNIKGAQGLQGEQGAQGPQGLPGQDGATGAQGDKGERGSLWISAEGVPAPSKNYKEFDCYIDELTYNIYVNNGSEWQLTGNIKGLQGEQGNQGEAGTDGKAGTIQIGNVSKGDNASITNRGTENAALLDFVLPKGDKGDAGSRWYSGTQEPNASTGVKDERGAPRSGDMYLQLAAAEHEAKTYIKLNNGEWSEPLGMVAGPEGKPASITVGTITTGEPGTKVIVENVGTSSDVIVNFTIPKGDKGEKGEQGIQGEKGDKGDKGDQGDKGDKGDQGQAATITIGTVTTGEPETDAIVTNVGDENNTRLNITIPKGQKGDKGDQGESLDLSPYLLAADAENFYQIKGDYIKKVMFNTWRGTLSFTLVIPEIKYKIQWDDTTKTLNITRTEYNTPQGDVLIWEETGVAINGAYPFSAVGGNKTYNFFSCNGAILKIAMWNQCFISCQY
ncbi:unnamed protein product, partial [Commensalibacter communis]